jgi:glutamate carboxypeptidase
MSGFRDGVIDTEAVLAAIERLVAIESPTSDPAGVNRVLDAIAPMFGDTSATLTREIVGHRFGEMLRVSCPGEDNGAGILVLSHVDTVHPRGTLAADLPIRREGDRLYGPGVFDMKGGAVLAITAYLRLASSGRRPKLPVTFLFTPDEETGSIGTRPHIEAAARASKYVLVTEPRRSGGRVVTSRKGTGRFQIDARGRPSHAGTHHADGRSAVRAIARTILEIEAWTDYQRGITTNVGLVSGGTGVNVVPEHARITADVRVVDPAMAIEMDARFRGLVPQEPGVTLQVTGGMTRPPWTEDTGTKALLAQVQAVGREIGLELEAGPRTGGGSDANFSAAIGIPTIDGLGVEGAGAHTLEEYMLISSVEPGVRLFQGLFERLA